jgi:hypothetical protein
MNEKVKRLHENNGNHGRGVFASGRKWALGAQKGIETALCQRITGTDWKKWFPAVFGGIGKAVG